MHSQGIAGLDVQEFHAFEGAALVGVETRRLDTAGSNGITDCQHAVESHAVAVLELSTLRTSLRADTKLQTHKARILSERRAAGDGEPGGGRGRASELGIVVGRAYHNAEVTGSKPSRCRSQKEVFGSPSKGACPTRERNTVVTKGCAHQGLQLRAPFRSCVSKSMRTWSGKKAHKRAAFERIIGSECTYWCRRNALQSITLVRPVQQN